MVERVGVGECRDVGLFGFWKVGLYEFGGVATG